MMGATIEVRGASPREFRDAIKQYTSARRGKEQACFWPLVSHVRVYSNSEILKDGVVLMDLPGFGDRNATRTTRAREAMKTCSHIVVCADVTRITDNHEVKSVCRLQKFLAFIHTHPLSEIILTDLEPMRELFWSISHLFSPPSFFAVIQLVSKFIMVLSRYISLSCGSLVRCDWF